MAGALAVTAACVAALIGLETVAMQREQLQPALHVDLDTYSLFELSLLRVINTGGRVAHNVGIEWRTPFLI